VDDRAITSMARLWEVGKSEPIKVGSASAPLQPFPDTYQPRRRAEGAAPRSGSWLPRRARPGIDAAACGC
jgi:hypothetical protein